MAREDARAGMPGQAVPASPPYLWFDDCRLTAITICSPVMRSRQSAEAGSDAQVGGVEWLGAMRDVGDIVGDIVSPASDPSDWAALHAETAERCPDISVIPGA